LGRAVQAKEQEARAPVDQGVVAVYAGDDGAAAALVHFDLPAAGSIAAAMTSVPADIVKQAARAGKLPQNLLDNLLEVANVLTKVVRRMSSARLRIQRIYPIRSAPPDIVAALDAPPCSVSFDVTVSEYPGGRVTVIGLSPGGAALSRQQESVLRRALIVDDSGAMRLVVARALGRLGVADVREASNGKEALKSLRKNTPVDAVFVDWSMPVMDGITFVKTVRTDKRLDRVRLIMVTTESDPDQMEAAYAAGADEYLVKPLSDDLLRTRLDGIGLKTN
ncbi:MAG TPA: response regulator, partial [Polyangia bacterium]|nr:response regulator [Polyangia bacterium]